MKTSDNANFLLLRHFYAVIVIHMSSKITQRIISWLSPKGQALKLLFAMLNFLLVKQLSITKFALQLTTLNLADFFHNHLNLTNHEKF